VPLIRGHHSFDDHFTQIPNDWLRDNRLTFKARGILSMIMSHSQGWSLSINSIAATNQEGKDAIRSAIKELEDFGYLLRTQINEGGKFGEAVWVTQDPADLPMTDNPTTENPTTKNNNIKEEQVKNNTQELFDEFWTAYPRKLDKAKAFRAFKSALKRAKFEDILAGVIAYRNDPKRDPDFTKYPATWLNSDAWENAATLPEVRADIERRREKALADSQAFLKEQEELAKKAAPPSPELRKKLGL
jgi:hypothetical protein